MHDSFPYIEQKQIYDPWNREEFIVIRIYAHPTQINEEDMELALQGLKNAGCTLVRQDTFDGDFEISNVVSAMTTAKAKVQIMIESNRRKQLNKELVKKTESLSLKELEDLLKEKGD